MRAVIDNNVSISGIFWKGNPSKILNSMLLKEFGPITSDDILDEFVSAMKRLKHPMSNENILLWECFLMCTSEIVTPSKN